MAKTTRPKARPNKTNTSLAPTTSLVPRTRSKARELELSRGDVEFRSDLENQLWYNPLARLGYDPTKVKSMPQEMGASAMYFPSENTKEGIEDALLRAVFPVDPAASGVERIYPDDTVFFSGTSQSPVIAHELTHRGLGEVIKFYKENPEYFKQTYGEEAAFRIDSLSRNRDQNEKFTELSDDLDATINIPSSYMTSMADARDFAKEDQQKKFQRDIAKKRPEDRSFLSEYGDPSFYGAQGILKAAEDLLKRKGEPPKAEANYPNFLEKTLGFRFAEGGLTMDQQMKRLFAEGGINTGEAKVDPVSGNEVPPGSLPSEVRDDINAKLSGGEYVVPADVLRFYGVAFFEKLRKKAKEGLSEMDAEGRIGGGTVEEEDFPFSVDELEAEDDMTFAEGGAVTPTTETVKATGFNPSDWSFGAGDFGGTGQTQVKKYKDRNGNIVNVLFINGKPVVDIQALGYTEYTEDTPVGTGEEVKKPEEPVQDSWADRNQDQNKPQEKIDPAKNYYNLAEKDLLNPDYTNALGGEKAGGIAQSLGMLAPGIGLGMGALKGFKDAQNLADARARKIIAQERGLDTTGLDATIAELEKNASGFVKGLDLFGLDGTGIAKRHKTDFEPLAAASKTTPVKTGSASTPSSTTTTKKTTTPTVSQSQESSSDRAPILGFSPSVTSPKLEAIKSVSTASPSLPSSSKVTTKSPSVTSYTGKASDYSLGTPAPTTTTKTTPSFLGGRAKGGLVQKPTRKKK